MKYRVIIADDEPKILQLIRQLGHWQELDIEIVDECRNGAEALESIVRNRPDFVLSDIQMPVYDGIELIRRVRDANVDPLFVLISGYRHFEYARSAIQLNVMDYLLKPIDEKQLNDTLRTICARIDERNHLAEQSKTLYVLQENQNRKAMERFWAKLLYRDETVDDACFSCEESCNQAFHTEFEPGCYQVFCVFSSLSAILEKSDAMGNGRLEVYIQESFPDYVRYYGNNTYMGYILVANYMQERKNEIRQAVLALYYKIRDLREIYGDIRLSIGCSRIYHSVSDLFTAFEEAHSAEWGRLVLTRNGVLDYDQIAQLPGFSMEELITREEIQTLLDCLRYLRQEELSDLMERVYQRAVRLNGRNPRDMMQCFFKLQAEIIFCFEDPERQTRMQEDSYYAYLNARNFQQVIRNLYLACQKYVEEEQKKLKEKMGKPIQLAVRYVREHYAEPISLEDVAEAGNVSPTYMSKLFKSEMQIGFNEFLTQVRLEESEKLLENTNLTVREIAAKVGYPDEKYYSKLFKKNTGIKPTDYRRIYSS
ncbi:MAG: response regulator [Lachnospiraceae bacterium]|nr:response regulator [Lachnospiraceae bacterium]